MINSYYENESLWDLYFQAKKLNADKIECYKLTDCINKSIGNKFYQLVFNRIKTDFFTITTNFTM